MCTTTRGCYDHESARESTLKKVTFWDSAKFSRCFGYFLPNSVTSDLIFIFSTLSLHRRYICMIDLKLLYCAQRYSWESETGSFYHSKVNDN